jgi:hypothetical protein
MDLVQTCAELEQHDDLHLARLLILINVFAGNKGTQTVEGLTKLAKLDFLLRYPAYLERALRAKQEAEEARKSIEKAAVADYERRSIESRMVRFRYGPWDHRYRRLLNILVGRGLVSLQIEGRTVKIGITEAGRQTANELIANEVFQPFDGRARLLKANFNIAGTNLMKFIYETFPEVVSLRYNEKI